MNTVFALFGPLVRSIWNAFARSDPRATHHHRDCVALVRATAFEYVYPLENSDASGDGRGREKQGIPDVEQTYAFYRPVFTMCPLEFGIFYYFRVLCISCILLIIFVYVFSCIYYILILFMY